MKVLVYGWYHQGNVGDDLFISAYQYLFPGIDFIFSDTITNNQLQDVDAVFFGGGSFLLDRPIVEDELLLRQKKIFYIGVGIESKVHPLHLELMAKASLIAIRTPDKLDKLKSLNKNTIVIPDLVYSLRNQVTEGDRIENSVLILPNIAVVPSRSDSHWRHAAWGYFKSEFSQFIDWLVDNGYHPRLWGMCHAIELDDDWVSAELISHMDKRDSNLLLMDRPKSIQDITKLVSDYQIVITQRFHGIVLSEMTGTPYVAIHHHDKLKFSKPGNGKFVSYYGSSKNNFIEHFYQARKLNLHNVLPIEPNIFETLVQEVNRLL